jgi:hypothetical protein
MAKKHVDPLKAKQKKQKIMAAGLAVAFLGLMAFQVPRVLKKLHPPPPPSVSGHTSTTAAPPAGTPTLAAPTLSGTPQPSATPTTGSLASATAPGFQDGILSSFSRFASKDPFSQQIDANKSSSPSSSGSGAPTSGGSTPSSPAGSGHAPGPGSAVISINGVLYSVQVGTDFPSASTSDPSASPLFHLVSLSKHTAKISIVGGSYANGGSTVTLRENKPVTLMNTADGTRYKLVLKPQGTNVPSTAPSSSGTTSTVELPPASPPSSP